MVPDAVDVYLATECIEIRRNADGWLVEVGGLEVRRVPTLMLAWASVREIYTQHEGQLASMKASETEVSPIVSKLKIVNKLKVTR